MRKALQVSVLAILLPSLGCAQVTIDAPSIAGFTAPRARITLANTTPFQVEVVAMGNEIGELAPGAAVYDNEPVPHEGADLPVMVRLSGPSGEFLGIAARILEMDVGSVASWHIDLGSVEFADGQRRRTRRGEEVYPRPRVSDDRRVDFPRALYASTTMLQVGNATLFEGVLTINGASVVMAPGDIYYAEFRSISAGRRQELAVSMRFVDDGKVVGYSSGYVVPLRAASSYNLPTAHQLVFGPRNIRR